MGLFYATAMKISEPNAPMSMIEYCFLMSFGPVSLSAGIILVQKFADKHQKDKVDTMFVNKPVLIISKYILILFAVLYIIFIGCGIGSLIFNKLIFNSLAKKEYSKAITLAKVLEKIPSNNCISSYISTYVSMKTNDRQYPYYEQQALKCNNGSYKTYYRIAWISADDKQYQYALTNIDKGLKINNESLLLRYSRGNTYFDMQDCKNGINEVEELLNIIDKKGTERYTFRGNDFVVEEFLPDNWREKILKKLSTCPNTNEKEELIKKIAK